MDKIIKTRDVIKDIKMLDKKAVVADGIRDVHAKTKEVAERSEAPDRRHHHSVAYAQT